MKLEPAVLHRQLIIDKFNENLYTDRYFWYTGSIENYEQELKEADNKFQFAILNDYTVVGYISFRVDWYCSCAYNFSLVRFKDTDSSRVMVHAIRAIIRMLQGFNLHRIDFRCVGGNPAERGYSGILKHFLDEYDIRTVVFRDNIKDRQGNYHDTIMYELIRRAGR